MAGHYIRASDERRQVLAAFLATLPKKDRREIVLPVDRDGREQIAELLLQSDHRTILTRGYGALPIGFRSALARAGSAAQRPLFYGLLHHLLAAEPVVAIRRVIHHLSDVSLHHLVLACVLPLELRHPAMIDRVSDVSEARDLSTALNYLRTRVADKDAYERALRVLGRGGDIREFLSRWLLRAKFPAAPFSAAGGLIPINDGVALRRAALLYRNCSTRYVIDLIEGRAHMATFVSPAGTAMVHLQHRSEIWSVEGIYGPGNREVNEETRRQILLLLKRVGIGGTHRSVTKDNPYAALRRLSPRGIWA